MSPTNVGHLEDVISRLSVVWSPPLAAYLEGKANTEEPQEERKEHSVAGRRLGAALGNSFMSLSSLGARFSEHSVYLVQQDIYSLRSCDLLSTTHARLSNHYNGSPS